MNIGSNIQQKVHGITSYLFEKKPAIMVLGEVHNFNEDENFIKSTFKIRKYIAYLHLKSKSQAYERKKKEKKSMYM